MTNGDRIRKMDDLELSEKLTKDGICALCAYYTESCAGIDCKVGILKFLQSEEGSDDDETG